MRELETDLLLEDILQENDNIATLLSSNDLNAIGSAVCEGYRDDLHSRSEWDEANEDSMKLALQIAEPKNDPWPGASNVKYPLLSTAALQFASRAYPALIPGTNVVKARTIGRDEMGLKQDRAERISRHMSYQILEEMDDWEEDMDKLCLMLPILGTVFKKTYYSAVKETNISELILPEDLVINYFSKSVESADRITHCIEMTDNEIYEHVMDNLFLDLELKKLDMEASETEEEQGIHPPEKDDDTVPYSILEQHCMIDLDGDGYKEPYIVTVDEGSEQVLRIVRRFENNDVSYVNRVLGVVRRIEPIHFFTKFGFIPSPDGSIYDLGFGTLLGPMNDTINTTINQLLDSGTLNNLQGGFVAKGVRVRGGDKPMQPGEWRPIETFGDDIRKAFIPLPTKEPSQVLFTLLDTMVSAGERLSSVTEMMSGEIPGQNVKATVAMAAIEQGMKVFNAIYKRIYRSMKKEFRKLYDLNVINLEAEKYFVILDPTQEEMAKIGPGDYRQDITDIAPAADPSIATEEQKLAKLTALGELMQLGTINPHEYTRRYLEATQQPNIEALMAMPPPQPSPEVMLEQAKIQDESARGWFAEETKRMEAMSKIEKTEVDGIVALVTARQKEAADMVNAALEKKKIEESSKEDASRSESVGKSPNN